VRLLLGLRVRRVAFGRFLDVMGGLEVLAGGVVGMLGGLGVITLSVVFSCLLVMLGGFLVVLGCLCVVFRCRVAGHGLSPLCVHGRWRVGAQRCKPHRAQSGSYAADRLTDRQLEVMLR